MMDDPNHRRCSRCRKVFASRWATDQHIRSVHKGVGERIPVSRHDDGQSLADEMIDSYFNGVAL